MFYGIICFMKWTGKVGSALCAAFALGVWLWGGRGTEDAQLGELSRPFTPNPSGARLVTTAHGTKLTTNQVAAARTKRKARSAKSLPQPQRGPAGDVLDFRVTLLPPGTNGVKRFRREWLIKPIGDGRPVCIEELCSGDELKPNVENCFEFSADRLLVTVDGNVDFARFTREMAAKGFTVEKPIMTLTTKNNAKLTVVHGPEATLGMVAKIKKGVMSYDPNAETCRDMTVYADSEPPEERIPNDNYFFDSAIQWGLKRIGATVAWANQAEATNVIVAVVDSGCNYNHEDLKDNIWVNPDEIPGNGVDDDNNGIADDIHGASFLDNGVSGDPYDGWNQSCPSPVNASILTAGWGHGTHCAGIVGASGDNDIGVVGVAWKVKIMPIRWMKPTLQQGRWQCAGSTEDAVRALKYAKDHGANICSCSFGSSYTEDHANLYNGVIKELGKKDIIVVCSAGNDGKNSDAVKHLPSGCQANNIVSVASSGKFDELSNFSNWGATSVDIAAPGEQIFSTDVSDKPELENCNYKFRNGTSMATPMVSGCLALIKAAFPDEPYWTTIERLYQAGDTISSMVGTNATGKRVNIGNVFAKDWKPAKPRVTVSQGEDKDRIIISWYSTRGTVARVYRAESETGELELISPSEKWLIATNWTDRTVSANKTYWYAVQVSKTPSDENASELSKRVSGFADNPDLDPWDRLGDDRPEGATLLTPGNTTLGGDVLKQTGHRFSELDTNDWYKIEAVYGATYSFTFEYEDMAGGVSGKFYRGDNQIGSSQSLTVSRREDASTYYFKVTPARSKQYPKYTICCTRTGGYDEWDNDGADDVPEGAHEMGANEYLPAPSSVSHSVSGLSLCRYDTNDWFKVELVAGETYVFRTTGEANTMGSLYFGTNLADPVKTDDDSGEGSNFMIRYTPMVSGVYYLQVGHGYKANGRAKDVKSAAYNLEYWREMADVNFVFTPDYLWEFLPPDEWQANPFLTTNAMEVAALSEITTEDEGIVRWAFNEEMLYGIEDGMYVTNLVEVLNAEGVRLMWGHAVYEDSLEDTLVDFTTQLPKLPAGMYRVRLTLNRDINGNESYPETDDTDNVTEISFTVKEPAKTPERLIIDGNAEIVGDATASYRCVAVYGDGTSGEVAANWTIVSGDDVANGEEKGGRYYVTGSEVETATNVVIRAEYTGLVQEKTITIVIEANERDSAFDPPVYHPDGHMDIASGLLRIAGVPATEGDEIAAFAVLPDGRYECRSHVYVERRGSFSMRIPLMKEGETIVFRAYDASSGDYGTVFDCLQAVPSAFDAVIGSAVDPFVVDAVRVDPFGTQKLRGMTASEVFATVTVGGFAAGEGDILAVFDGDTLVGKQLVTFRSVGGMATLSASGTTGAAQSAAALTLYLGEGTHPLTFKVWDASAGRLRDCNETVELASGGSAGSASEPIALSADVPTVEPESRDPEIGDELELPPVEPIDPTKTHTVTFNLAGGADRVGGGALVQSVVDGASAVAPQIVCRKGYVFNYWNYPTNNVRSDRTITAAYRTDTRKAPVRVDYAWLDGGMGAGPHTVADYEAAAMRLTGKVDANGQPMRLWQDYLAGTDPGNPNDIFKADISFVDGLPQVLWTPNLNTNGENRIYTIWGKESLEDEHWIAPTNAATRFFKVTVDEL